MTSGTPISPAMPAIPLRLLEPEGVAAAKPSQKVLVGETGWPATKYEAPKYLDLEYTGGDKIANLEAFLHQYGGERLVKGDGRTVARFSYATM